MNRPLRLGISPCPNDTFVFHGLLERASDAAGLELEIELADVEELNQRFARGELDAAKCSFHAAATLAPDAVVLPVGAALGFGVGPVLLAAAGAGPPSSSTRVLRPASRILRPGSRVLCPGERTTAHLLYRLFHAGVGEVEHVRFSDILPQLENGLADFGVCIHEARFTYEAHGLALVEDLGASWERHTGGPLALGGILARRALGDDVLARLSRAISSSLACARADREAALATMRRHAQEMSERVLWQHVELYVNEWTADLGEQGRRAIARLGEAAREIGLVPSGAPPLDVFRPPEPADHRP